MTKTTHGFLRNPDSDDLAVASVSVVICIAAVAIITSGRLRFVLGRWAITLGALTYPLYLLHNRIGRLFWDRMDISTHPTGHLALSVVSAILLSWLVNEFVERRLVRRFKLSKLFKKLMHDKATSAANREPELASPASSSDSSK